EEDADINKRLLTPGQARTLVNYINKLTLCGLHPTHAMVRNLASSLVKRYLGECWVKRFIERHKNTIKLSYLLPLDKVRKKANSALYYSLYFELLGQKIKRYDILPENTYNIDKKGFLIGKFNKGRRIYTRYAFELGRMPCVIQDGNRECITIVVTICADGTALSPGLIYQAVELA
ncbi:hypothetical protein K432DRAFT_313067, partial [Lepidopterella palustris CBS 459.81]